MNTAKIFGRIRGITSDILYGSDNEETPIELSQQGEQLVAEASPNHCEITRQGRTYWCNTGSAPVASVVAMPTTATGFNIFNNEPDGGRSYVICQVWMMVTAQAGATIPQSEMIACLGQVRETAPADLKAATVIQKTTNGGTKLDSRARINLAVALPATTGFAGNWFPIGGGVTAAVSALPGFQKTVNVEGRYIVPPGRYFAIHCVSSNVSVVCAWGILWQEKFLNLG